MSSAPKVLFGFHAVGVRVKTAPQSVIEIYFDPTRRDARMRQFIDRANEGGIRLIEADGPRLAKLSGGHGHQGVAARVTEIKMVHSLDELLEGIDIDLSAELARELKVQLHYVESSFPRLVDDLKADRCDVAMFAVGVLPQRKAVLDFTQPYLQSDIYAVTTRANRVVRQWSDLDKPGVVIAVLRPRRAWRWATAPPPAPAATACGCEIVGG